jgi:hypothetical protein
VFLAQDPSFDLLHADPRFTALVERVAVYRQTSRRAVDGPG